MEQRQRLIDTFLLSVHVYDDKMLICLKYIDGEICMTKEEIDAAMHKKANSGNRNDCRSSPLKACGDPPAIRTPDTLLKRACPESSCPLRL
ncbi:MAG: hypothetical protein FWG72_08245 [Oscillospiraceae bacterium]|nr:hypothetical protein [Oscillospiraceae bacterium]